MSTGIVTLGSIFLPLGRVSDSYPGNKLYVNYARCLKDYVPDNFIQR